VFTERSKLHLSLKMGGCMAKQRFRVTINGFRVQAETWDTAFEGDGKGDEVKISVSVKEANKAGDIVYSNEPETPVMGDVNNQRGRILAGSRSAKGGLRSGDSFPDSTPWIRSIPLSTERDYPPFLVWEGELIEGENVVFITPTLWEWDEGQSFWEGWLNWVKETDDNFGKKAKDIFGGQFPLIGWIFDAVSLGIQTAATLTNVGGPLGNSGTRPIGMKKDQSAPGGKTFTYSPQVIVLTYDTARKIAATNSGQGPGVLTLRYEEHPYFRGNYLLYVQVEASSPVEDRIPPGGEFRDGTLHREEWGGIYVIHGGAKFLIPTMEILKKLYPGVPVAQVWDGALNALPTVPKDGTLLREESGEIYVIHGGAKVLIPNMEILKRLYPGVPVAQVWNGALAAFPTATTTQGEAGLSEQPSH
jgi:hypothetical protein